MISSDVSLKDLQPTLELLKKAYATGSISSTAPLMCLFKIMGKVATLHDFFLFTPLYRSDRPRRRIFLSARQTGKTWGIASSNILACNLQPYYYTLFVQPRWEQIKRFSTEIVNPLLKTSIFRDTFSDETCLNSVLRKTYANGSAQHFQFAFLDPDRIRGLSGICEVNIDEVQDMNWEFIPVIGETMSGRPEFGFYTFSGTPKSLDNTSHYLWRESSQAEWIVQCSHCNKWNIPSTDHDLLKMIGEETVVCAKCGKPLDCRQGEYFHRFRDRRADFSGYHGSQIIHPYHYEYPDKWRELHQKLRDYPTWRLYNEVFGESYDAASRLITQDSLRSACRNWENSLETALKSLKRYDPIVMGVDWAGGGLLGNSHTAVAIGGMRKGADYIDIIYGTKFPLYVKPKEEMGLLLTIYRKLQQHAGGTPVLFAHDFTGLGYRNEMAMVNAGIPARSVVPLSYGVSSKKEVISREDATSQKPRISFMLDKPRSLVILCSMLDAGKVRLPTWDSQKLQFANNEPVSVDFLHLYGEVSERLGSDVYLVKKEPNTSDDWAHAVNYVCSASWYYHQRYPDLSEAMGLRLNASDVEAICPREPDWFKG